MSLKGNLQSVDLANVLQMLSINQKEGTLVLFDGDTRKSIYFSKDGVSMLSRGRRTQDSLGRILLRYGRITDQVLADALARQEAEGKRLGEVLEEMGVVTSSDIDDAIRTQIEEEIYNLFIWKEASFEFIEGPPPEAMEGAATRVTFNVNSLIMEAQRRADEWNYIRGLVPSLDEIYRPTEKMAEAVVTDEVFHFPFAPRVIEKLQVGRMNVSELIETSHAAKFEGCKIIAILLEQGAVEPLTLADLQTFAQESASRGDHKQAAKFLSRVVDLGGATPPVNMSLGYALEAMDEPERASIYFKAAAESFVEAMEPKPAFDAYQRIARALPTDVAAVTQMVEIACNNPEILGPNRHEVTEAGRILAQCLRELGRQPSAIQVLNSLCLASPQDMPLRNMLVQAYQDSGMLNEAMVELESMADFCAGQKNWDEAIRCLRRVIGIDRNRAGALKKIEAYTKARDSGKRLVLRVVAIVAVVASVLAAVWGFGVQQEMSKANRAALEETIGKTLDPLRTSFGEAENEFAAARGDLEGWKDSSAETVQKEIKTLERSMKTMEDLLAATMTGAADIYQKNESRLGRDFVEVRTKFMKEHVEKAHQDKGVLTENIYDGAKLKFVDLRKEALKHPLKCIKPVERVLELLQAIGKPTAVYIDTKMENVEDVLVKLNLYKTQVEDAQAHADAKWKEGRYRESHGVLADFLGPLYPVDEFREILAFHVHVTTVPSVASVRIVGGNGADPGSQAPADLPYTAAGGLLYEVSAPGFMTVRREVLPMKGIFDTGAIMEKLPWEERVVLTKVPVWTAQLGAAGIDALPEPTTDGHALVVADRNGGIHLLSVEDGSRIQSADCKSVSGFRSSPLVTKDSVYAASLDGVVVALDLPSLNVRWRKEPAEGPGPVYGRPVLVADQLVVAGTTGTVMAFDAQTGEKRWEAKLDSGTMHPLVAARGWIVITCEDGRLRTLGTDGKGIITVLPSGHEEAGYPPPRSTPLQVGEQRILVGLEGAGQEFSLVELPVPGASSPHVGYKWGAAVPGAEVSGACVNGDEILLLYSNGILWRVSSRRGPQEQSDLRARVVPEKETPVRGPAFRDGMVFVATLHGLGASKPGNSEFVEVWRWSSPKEVVITSPPLVVGRIVVVGSRDGRLFALLRD